MWVLHNVSPTQCESYTVWVLQCESYTVCPTQCESYTVWVLHVSPTQCVLHSVSPSQCESYTVWVLHSVSYTVWVLHSVSYTMWGLHSVSYTVRVLHSVSCLQFTPQIAEIDNKYALRMQGLMSDNTDLRWVSLPHISSTVSPAWWYNESAEECGNWRETGEVLVLLQLCVRLISMHPICSCILSLVVVTPSFKHLVGYLSILYCHGGHVKQLYSILRCEFRF